MASASASGSDNVEDAELRMLRDGGEKAVAELFSRYADQLQRMVRFRLDRRLCGRVDTADVLQEAYLEAARRVQDYVTEPAVPFFVWLRRITAQSMIDIQRRHLGAKMRDVNQEVSLHRGAWPHASSLSLASHLIGDWTSPSQAAIRDEMLGELRAALDSMDGMDREVLALRHFEELSNNEVAVILGIQKSAASNRYMRALRRLKDILAKMSSFQDDEE